MPLAELGDISLHYREHGDGDPVLGIMGFSLDQRFWAAQIPAVTATNRFIVFDNRGTGRSGREAPTSIDQMADDAVHLLDHLEIDRTVVFGVSMGGAIAQSLVLRYPERVRALILAVTWARPLEYMRRRHGLAVDLVSSAGPEALVQGSLLWMFSPEFFEMGRETIDRMVAAFLSDTGPEAVEAETLLAQMDAIDKHDVVAQLGSISVPTLVLGGRRDIMVPGFASEELAAAIPGAELTMFETGHGCMIEEMEPFNARVSQFLSGLR
jgi:pimeloyl-ACP methyl ester carboxylesterase